VFAIGVLPPILVSLTRLQMGYLVTASVDHPPRANGHGQTSEKIALSKLFGGMARQPPGLRD
jgi:hypothetical protein